MQRRMLHGNTSTICRTTSLHICVGGKMSILRGSVVTCTLHYQAVLLKHGHHRVLSRLEPRVAHTEYHLTLDDGA
jgi:hypothetical protein